jgi:hypothetical protein
MAVNKITAQKEARCWCLSMRAETLDLNLAHPPYLFIALVIFDAYTNGLMK